MVPLGPRRFRQLVGLETLEGKRALGLHYIDGRAAVERAPTMREVERLRLKRRARGRLRQENLAQFAEPCPVDPVTGERLCVEEGCAAASSGRGKLCEAHSAARATARAARRSRRKVPARRA